MPHFRTSAEMGSPTSPGACDVRGDGVLERLTAQEPAGFRSNYLCRVVRGLFAGSCEVCDFVC
ncbi:hypothetical protein FHU29_000986 [Hoyosella altamirensis]|uniref:Uncharacterized protein n=1 Tax=Hoyosella altamirensis TaxID=616997 RepID=A0A839RIC1_9ACTN|nr:hypothetical protein [Hoyosella altamirensis]